MKPVIQTLLLLGIAGVLVMFVRGQHGVRMQASKRLAFFAFLVLNAVAVLWPEGTTWVAKLVGIGRGADLLLYALIVTFVFVVINFYLRLRESEQRVTELARAVAIRDAELLNRDRGLIPGTPESRAPTTGTRDAGASD
jgi:small membrane protein